MVIYQCDRCGKVFYGSHSADIQRPTGLAAYIVHEPGRPDRPLSPKTILDLCDSCTKAEEMKKTTREARHR